MDWRQLAGAVLTVLLAGAQYRRMTVPRQFAETRFQDWMRKPARGFSIHYPNCASPQVLRLAQYEPSIGSSVLSDVLQYLLRLQQETSSGEEIMVRFPSKSASEFARRRYRFFSCCRNGFIGSLGIEQMRRCRRPLYQPSPGITPGTSACPHSADAHELPGTLQDVDLAPHFSILGTGVWPLRLPPCWPEPPASGLLRFLRATVGAARGDWMCILAADSSTY